MKCLDGSYFIEETFQYDIDFKMKCSNIRISHPNKNKQCCINIDKPDLGTLINTECFGV